MVLLICLFHKVSRHSSVLVSLFSFLVFLKIFATGLATTNPKKQNLANTYQNVKTPRLRSLIFYLNTRKMRVKNVDDFQYILTKRVRRLHKESNYLTLKWINCRESRSLPIFLLWSTNRIIWKTFQCFLKMDFLLFVVYFGLIFMFLIIRSFNNLMWRTFDWLNDWCLTQNLAVFQLYRGVSNNKKNVINCKTILRNQLYLCIKQLGVAIWQGVIIKKTWHR